MLYLKKLEWIAIKYKDYIINIINILKTCKLENYFKKFIENLRKLFIIITTVVNLFVILLQSLIYTLRWN